MLIKTSDIQLIKSLVNKLKLPSPDSHKGQNGRVLIIGGSSLFHSASIWAAEIASHFVDIVHYCSTKENEEIFLSYKKKFRNGIIIRQKDLLAYVKEDDAVLIGPGMLRSEKRWLKNNQSHTNYQFSKIQQLKNESHLTFYLTKYLINNFSYKKMVFDAGALQMMDPSWLKILTTPPIITPHQQEFENLFKIKISNKTFDDKIRIVHETAKKYHCVILLKTPADIISDGEDDYVIQGGNPGLTKGGTGDLLAGLCLSFFAKNSPLISATIASWLLKKSADELSIFYGNWYNIDNLINQVPQTFTKLLKKLELLKKH
ncbi:MAG: NAD(P)H-hydrate dehydratase [Microgenomates group bacterium]|nr:NAD(P)H-hydrate dehydratase [Microgenomates group bacterium]